MGQILLKTKTSGTTLVSNTFIDEYLTKINEVQVKIYLYLLRCLGDSMPVDVPMIADKFNYSEKDILRALGYLAREGLLSVDYDNEMNIVGICVNDCRTCSAVEAVPSANAAAVQDNTTKFYSADQISSFKSSPDIQQVIFVAQQLFVRTMNPKDLNTLLYVHEHLGFSAQLLEYLVEYCADCKKTSMAYLEKVAIAWAQDGITTVEAAKARKGASPYMKQGYSILKELGVSGRSLTNSDLEYINKWFDEYHLSLDIILEGCRRTIVAISKPSMPYLDSILSKWHSAEVHTFEDIARLDENHKANNASIPKTSRQPASRNKFCNFDESGTDYDALAQKLIEQQNT